MKFKVGDTVIIARPVSKDWEDYSYEMNYYVNTAGVVTESWLWPSTNSPSEAEYSVRFEEPLADDLSDDSDGSVTWVYPESSLELVPPEPGGDLQLLFGGKHGS